MTANFELNLQDNSGLARFCFYQSSPRRINEQFQDLLKRATHKNSPVILVPDMLDHEDFNAFAQKGGWMNKDNFIE